MKTMRGELQAIGIALTVACLAHSALWAASVGSTGADLLNLGVGARAIAMGEAYTSLADDSSSLYWNPAGLAILNQSEASFMYNSYLEGVSQSHAAVATPLEHGGLGAAIDYLSYGEIQGTNFVGDPNGTVNTYSGVATVGGGLLGDTWAAGATMKGIRTQLADTTANDVAFDAGGTLIYPHEVLGGATWRFGATVRNMGPGMKFLQESDPLPTQWRIGTSLLQLLNDHLTLSTDYGKMRGDKGIVYMGGEYEVGSILALRAGYAGTSAEGNGLRAGIGLRLKSLSFDYAFASYGDLGLTHRYELTFHFGDIRPRLTPEEREMLKRAKIAMQHQRYDEAVLILDSLDRLVPHYNPIQHLLKYAMSKDEVQERMAKQQGSTTIPQGMTLKRSGTLSDLDDVESLLRQTDPDTKTKVGQKTSNQDGNNQ